MAKHMCTKNSYYQEMRQLCEHSFINNYIHETMYNHLNYDCTLQDING